MPKVMKKTAKFRAVAVSVNVCTDRSSLNRKVSCQLQTDQGNDSPHRCGRKDNIDPLCADTMDDEGHDTANNTQYDETALRILKALVGDDDARRSDEGKT